MKFSKIILLIVIAFTFNNCDHFFEFSVYEANVIREHKNTTAKNLELLKNVTTNSDDFKFAFITDVHYYYDDLKTIVDDINKRDDIKFVVFGGDIADQALLKEYEIFYDIMTNLKKPYLTVIGNHDYNSNGAFIYKQMFGDYNYSFEFNNNKFVVFDNIYLESDNEVDFDWLSSALSDNANYNQVFSFAHIPTISDDITPEMQENYKSIMLDNNVALSVHGHTHSYSYEPGVVSYLIIPTVKDTAYGIISVQKDTFNVELIELK